MWWSALKMMLRLMNWPCRAFSISEEGIPAGAVVACSVKTH